MVTSRDESDEKVYIRVRAYLRARMDDRAFRTWRRYIWMGGEAVRLYSILIGMVGMSARVVQSEDNLGGRVGWVYYKLGVGCEFTLVSVSRII